jgi:hypothetical protein
MPRALVSLLAAFAVMLAAVPSTALGARPLREIVRHDLHFARTQLKQALAEVPVDRYPNVIREPDGKWHSGPVTAWTSGFFPGCLWLMYKATGDPAWRTAAEQHQAGLESQKTRTSTHDLGFVLFDSFGKGYGLTGVDHYRQVVLTAAGSLATRYSRTVGAIRSVNNLPSSDPTDFRVIVDNLPNLELLSWAAGHGGDSRMATFALRHALTSARAHVRADGSTFQLAVFDSETGAVKRRGTTMGYSASSAWARGQAWALHGFTTVYRYTRNPRVLSAARSVARYFVSHLPRDRVPLWDFNAPRSTNPPRDSSAAAIAASGLLDLSRLEPDGDRARRHLEAAKAILRSLSSPAYLAEGTKSRSLLLHGTSDWRRGPPDRGLIYGDYFFLEALLRYRAMEREGT